MRKTFSCRVTGLLLGTGLVAVAGGPNECVAQIRSAPDQKRLALSAAIEEVRRSPFHAGARTGEPEEARRAGPDSDSDIASAPSTLQLAPSEEDPPSRWSHLPATLIVAGLSHLTATYVLWGCGGNVPRCILAPIVPLVATPIPALLAGADSGRAFGASVVGLLLGGAAYIGVLKVTENFHVATAASSLVHAGMMTAALGAG